jgi:hypothetical protein
VSGAPTPEELRIVDRIVNRHAELARELGRLTTQLHRTALTGDPEAWQLVHQDAKRVEDECARYKTAAEVLRELIGLKTPNNGSTQA